MAVVAGPFRRRPHAVARPAVADPDDPAEVVRRWETSGGVWRVLADRDGVLVVGLFQCTGGELMQQVSSGDLRLRAVLDGRLSSDD